MKRLWLAFLASLIGLMLFCPSLVLAAEDVTTLKEVEVNSTPLEKYLVTTSVITDKDIEAKGARNLAEALEDIPGLNFHRGRKNANTVDIRGSSLSYVKIYIDGVFVNPLAKVNGSDSVDLNMFPTSNIAKIEVIKGPAPVSYGTDAMGGMILITTKNGKGYQGGNVSLSGGSYGTLNGSVSYGGGDDKFSYFINGGSEHSNGFVDNANRTTSYFNTKMTWALPDDASLTFLGGYSTTDKGCLNAIDPTDGHVISSKSGFWAGLNSWEFRDWVKTNLALDYEKKVNEKLDYDLKVYRYTEKQGLWANGATYDPSSGVTLTAGHILAGNASKDIGYDTRRWNVSPWDSTLNGVELQSNLKVNSAHTLTYGLLYNDISWKKGLSANPATDPFNPDTYYWSNNYKNKRTAYYLQDNFLANDRTTITLGVRHDDNEVTNVDGSSLNGSATNPSINVVYQLDNRNTLRTSYGETCSFPLINQLFGTFANPNLKPEKSKNYEIGWKHQFDKTLTGDIALFKNDFNDRIASDPVTKIPYNLTSARIEGLEVELAKQFSSQWDGFVNYAHLNTSSVNTDGSLTDLTYTPKDHLNYGLNYKPGNGYKISLNGHWVSSRYTGDTYTTGSDTRTVKQKVMTLPSYHVLDARISKQINANQDWFIEVDNVFDKEYEDELFYPAPGRTTLVGMNCKF